MQESNSTKEHKKQAPLAVNAAIVTVSDSRTIENDDSGKLIKGILIKNNHKVIEHTIIKDDKKEITRKIEDLIKNNNLNLIITNGGTGLAKKDLTIEAIKPLFEKEISGFAVLFQKISYDEIGSACMLSRAAAGIINNKVIFCLPGSPKACELALEKLIIPEIGHIVKHIHE